MTDLYRFVAEGAAITVYTHAATVTSSSRTEPEPRPPVIEDDDGDIEEPTDLVEGAGPDQPTGVDDDADDEDG